MLKYHQKLLPFTLVFITLAFLLFCFDAQAEKKPDKKDLTAALQENVPNFFKINSLTIEEMENLASKSSPNQKTRITAKFCNQKTTKLNTY